MQFEAQLEGFVVQKLKKTTGYEADMEKLKKKLAKPKKKTIPVTIYNTYLETAPLKKTDLKKLEYKKILKAVASGVNSDRCIVVTHTGEGKVPIWLVGMRFVNEQDFVRALAIIQNKKEPILKQSSDTQSPPLTRQDTFEDTQIDSRPKQTNLHDSRVSSRRDSTPSFTEPSYKVATPQPARYSRMSISSSSSSSSSSSLSSSSSAERIKYKPAQKSKVYKKKRQKKNPEKKYKGAITKTEFTDTEFLLQSICKSCECPQKQTVRNLDHCDPCALSRSVCERKTCERILMQCNPCVFPRAVSEQEFCDFESSSQIGYESCESFSSDYYPMNDQICSDLQVFECCEVKQTCCNQVTFACSPHTEYSACCDY